MNKNEARDALKKALRAYNKAYLLYNPKVTDEDKERMGLPLYGGAKSPVNIPDSVSVLTVALKNPRKILVHYHDSVSGKRGKPAYVHGIEIRWAILDHFPADLEELTKSACLLSFAEHERRQKVYLCSRWEIMREDEKGPFGEIIEVVIP